MYEKHFGLSRKPFGLSPNADILFWGASHKRTFEILQKEVQEGRGVLLVTGPVGTGKTTLINALVAELKNAPAFVCVLANPTLSLDDFLRYWAGELGIQAGGSSEFTRDSIFAVLGDCWKERQKVYLLIDEAHCLPDDILGELARLIKKAEQAAPGVLTVFLLGQPELLNNLKRDSLQIVRNCISARYELQRLTREETLQYVLFRLNRAGAKKSGLFSERALAMIYRATDGNPRQINILCDTCLLYAYAEGMLQVSEQVVRTCAEQLRLDGTADTCYVLPPARRRRTTFLLAVTTGGVALTAFILLVFYGYQHGWIALAKAYLRTFFS